MNITGYDVVYNGQVYHVVDLNIGTGHRGLEQEGSR